MTGCADPYRQIKEKLTGEALRVLDYIKKLKPEGMSSQEATVRISISGNSLDAATKSGIKLQEALKGLHFLYDKPLDGVRQAFFRSNARWSPHTSGCLLEQWLSGKTGSGVPAISAEAQLI
jgi:hypothetical protein